MFLLGLQALGGRLGLWIGDPNCNDGEEVWGWPIGLPTLALLLGPAALGLYAVRRRVGVERWLLSAGLLIVSAVATATFAGLITPIWQW